MYFSVKCENTQEKPKGFGKTLNKPKALRKQPQEPKIGSKNPRFWEKTQGVATLVGTNVLHSGLFVQMQIYT